MSEIRLVRPPGLKLPGGASAQLIESFDGAKIRVVHYGGPGGRGSCLIVPGWTEPSEKYAEVALDLQDRGFNVFAYDPRGQGLSQRADGEDQRPRLDDFSKMVRDVGAVVEHIGGDAPVVLAHSMGGLAALSWLAEGGQARAAVLSAPATRIFPNPFLRLGVDLVTMTLNLAGFGDRPLTKESGQALRFEGNTLTSDRERHGYLRDLLMTDEALALPRMTSAGVRSLHRQQAKLHRRGALDGLTVPVRIVSLTEDSWVDSRDHREIARRSSMIDLVEIEGSRHEVLMERDEFRDQFWDAFDAHIDAYVPSPGPEAART